MYNKLILVASLLLSSAAYSQGCENVSFAEFKKSDGVSIRGPLSIAEIEKDHMTETKDTGKLQPFGDAYNSWVQFKNKKDQSGEIYFFSQRVKRYYHDGYVLVSGGCVIETQAGGVVHG